MVHRAPAATAALYEADETAWLAVARKTTVRALAARIRQAAPRDDEAESDEVDFSHYRQRCPQRVRRLWQDCVELARRMAGTSLTSGQAAEAIAAEGLSARPAPETIPAPSPRTAAGVDDHEPFVPVDWEAIREALAREVAVLLGL